MCENTEALESRIKTLEEDNTNLRKMISHADSWLSHAWHRGYLPKDDYQLKSEIEKLLGEMRKVSDELHKTTKAV